jgi:hypothetical protein
MIGSSSVCPRNLNLQSPEAFLKQLMAMRTPVALDLVVCFEMGFGLTLAVAAPSALPR